MIDKLFGVAEIAGRRERGARTGEHCPMCGTRGYERLGANFGLCQLSIGVCPEGRQISKRAERVTQPDNPTVLNYVVLGLEIMEVDSPFQRSALYIDGPTSFMFDPGVVLGYSVEEWQNDVKIGHATPSQFARDMRSPINIRSMSQVRRIQILHVDKVIRVEHTPF